MKKRHLLRRKASSPRRKSSIQQSTWLPFVDNSIFPHIFSFGHVKGIAKLFIEIEIVFSLLLVIGTCILVCLHFAR